MADVSGAPDAGPPAPEPANKGVLGALSEPGVLQRVVCGGFAWAVTVAPAAFSRGASNAAGVVAVLALVAAVVGPALVPSRRWWGRHLGITVFLALATGTWLLSPQAIAIERLDLVRAGIGAVGWAVYALSWGEPWRLREAPTAQEDIGTTLRARAQLPPLAVPLAAMGVAGAFLVMTIGWRVREPSRALLAQALSIGLAVALVTAAAEIAVSRGKARFETSRSAVPKSAGRSILVLVVFALLGGAVLVLRSR
jgi:hypothetical protein